MRLRSNGRCNRWLHPGHRVITEVTPHRTIRPRLLRITQRLQLRTIPRRAPRIIRLRAVVVVGTSAAVVADRVVEAVAGKFAGSSQALCLER